MKTLTRTYFAADISGELEVIETGEGFLKAKVTAARAGVFPYLENDDVVWKAKLPADLFSEETLNTARGAIVVEGHPMVDGVPILITPENAWMYTKGNISEPRVVGDKVEALETVTDADLIAKLKRGEKREVSIGFLYDEVEQLGSYDGKPYTRKQTNIRINHLSHEEAGRAGPEVRINLDREDCIMAGKKAAAAGPKDKATDGDDKTFSYRLLDGSRDIAVDSIAHSELMSLRGMVTERDAKIEGHDKIVEDLTKKVEALEKDPKVEADAALQKTIETLNGKLSASDAKAVELEKTLKKERDELPTKIADGAKIRKQLEDDAKAAGVEGVDSLNDDQVRDQIIAKVLPFGEGVTADSITPEIRQARYDAAMELLRAKANDAAPENGPTGDGIAVDEAAIAKKREELGNVYERKQKEREEGGKE